MRGGGPRNKLVYQKTQEEMDVAAAEAEGRKEYLMVVEGEEEEGRSQRCRRTGMKRWVEGMRLRRGEVEVASRRLRRRPDGLHSNRSSKHRHHEKDKLNINNHRIIRRHRYLEHRSAGGCRRVCRQCHMDVV